METRMYVMASHYHRVVEAVQFHHVREGKFYKGGKEKEEKNCLEKEFLSHFALYLVEREVSKIQLSSWKFQMAKHLTHR